MRQRPGRRASLSGSIRGTYRCLRGLGVISLRAGRTQNVTHDPNTVRLPAKTASGRFCRDGLRLGARNLVSVPATSPLIMERELIYDGVSRRPVQVVRADIRTLEFRPGQVAPSTLALNETDAGKAIGTGKHLNRGLVALAPAGLELLQHDFGILPVGAGQSEHEDPTDLSRSCPWA